VIDSETGLIPILWRGAPVMVSPVRAAVPRTPNGLLVFALAALYFFMPRAVDSHISDAGERHYRRFSMRDATAASW